MSYPIERRSLFFGLFPIVLLGVLALCAASPALAGRSICRGDPIITLSSGVVITMTEDIATDPSLVQSVTYTLNAPRGTTITDIQYVGDIPPEKQTVVLIADRDAGRYHTRTHVHMGGSHVAVTATLQLGPDARTGRGHTDSDVKLDLDVR